MNVVLDVLWLLVKVLGLMVWSWVKWLLPSRPKSLTGETVLVTGAGSGIGRLMALKFAERGCKLVLWDVNQKGNEETGAMIKKLGGKALCYKVDVSRKQVVDQAAAKVKQDIGDITILVNNAGIVIGRSVLDLTEDEFTQTMSINTMAHVWTLKAFLPDMIKRNHGHVVTVASVMAFMGLPKLSDYSASKGAARAIHESVQREVLQAGADKINFTLVCPYLMHTGMFSGVKIEHESLLEGLDPEYAAERVLKAVQTNQAVLCMPRTMYLFVAASAILPVDCFYVIEKFFNVWGAMDDFIGRGKQKFSDLPMRAVPRSPSARK